MGNSFLELKAISKSFGPVQAVDDVTVAVERGEIFSLLGPSGCGKTTLLRVCAGLESPDAGRVVLDGEDITELPPNRRQINTIFQNYALFPHLSVRDNVAFGLRVRRLDRRSIVREVDRMLELVQMSDQAHKRPDQLSGGQKQRVAIARALINKPRVLLLDEPLAALDLKLRQRMLVELDEIHDEVGISFVFVTHDQIEAMSLSDRIAVMNRGRIEQTGTPAQIYEAPVNSFVAAFIGDTNFFEGRVVETPAAEYSRVSIEGFPVPVLCFNDRPRAVGNAVHLSIRPEKLSISLSRPELGGMHNTVEGTIEDVIYQGPLTRYWVRIGEYRLAVSRQHRRFLLDEQRTMTWNDRVWLSWHADDGFMLERYREADEELLSLPE